MQLEINITSDKSPGVLARVIVALRRNQLNLLSQQMTEHDDTRELALMVQGAPTANVDDVLVSIRAISGVARAVVGGAEDNVAQGAETPPAQIEGDSLAADIANAFPHIGDHVAQHLDTLKPEHASEAMFALGMEVAQLRKNLFAELPAQATMDDFIAQRLLPDVQQLSTAEVSDEGLKVLSSIFTKTKKASGFGYPMGGSDAVLKCDFLSGYIQGMLESTPGMQYGHVEETMCRKEGQPYCLFEFDQN